MEIERSEAIHNLHKKLTEALSPMRVQQDSLSGGGEQGYAMTFTSRQREYDSLYGYADAMELYNPHFTLSRFKDEQKALTAAREITWDIPEFTMRSFGVFTMGEHGTCTERLLDYSA